MADEQVSFREWLRSVVSQLLKTPLGIISLIALICLVATFGATFWFLSEGIGITRVLSEKFVESNEKTNEQVRIAVQQQSASMARIADLSEETARVGRETQRFQMTTEAVHARQETILNQLAANAQQTLLILQQSNDRDDKIEEVLTSLLKCIEEQKKTDHAGPSAKLD